MGAGEGTGKIEIDLIKIRGVRFSLSDYFCPTRDYFKMAYSIQLKQREQRLARNRILMGRITVLARTDNGTRVKRETKKKK